MPTSKVLVEVHVADAVNVDVNVNVNVYVQFNGAVATLSTASSRSPPS